MNASYVERKRGGSMGMFIAVGIGSNCKHPPKRILYGERIAVALPNENVSMLFLNGVLWSLPPCYD